MIFRCRMVGILFIKELKRIGRARSAVLLLLLLISAAVLMTLGWPDTQNQRTACWVVYERQSELIRQLQSEPPGEFSVRFIPRRDLSQWVGQYYFPDDTYAIELGLEIRGRSDRQTIRFHHPVGQKEALIPIMQWFWRATHAISEDTPDYRIELASLEPGPARTEMSHLVQGSLSSGVTTEKIGTMLLLGMQFFVCCHLLVSFASQDRERGTQRAIALSPAGPFEILAARYLAHLLLSLTSCAAVMAVLRAEVLLNPVWWLTISVTSLGWMAVGTVMVSLARTQAAASMLTLSYMVGGSILFFFATWFVAFWRVQHACFEYYSIALLHGSIAGAASLLSAPVATLCLIVLAWLIIANLLFRRIGWQT